MTTTHSAPVPANITVADRTAPRRKSLYASVIGIAFGGLAAGALALAPTSGAIVAPSGGSNASDTIAWLESQGHEVHVNGTASQGSLSKCTATSIHGLRSSHIDDDGYKIDDDQFTKVYVDIHCNDTV